MSIISKLSIVKSKLAKLFLRKDKNYKISIIIGVLVGIIVVGINNNRGFLELERLFQALIFQIGYEVPSDSGLVTIVKKDQTSQNLLHTIPDRKDYASLVNFLGSSQKRELLFKSRSQNVELFSLKIGFYEKIRNQRPIATSWHEWINLIDESENKNSKRIDYFDQDKWKGNSKQVSDYFRKPENKDKPGFTSFIKVTGNTWKPKGKNIFKVLAGINDYLVFPTLCVDWNSKEVREKVESILGLDDDNDNIKKRKTDNKEGNKQDIEKILSGWQKIFNNLQYAEVVYEFKLFPAPKKSDENAGTEKNFISLSIKLKTYGKDTSYVVEPAAVIGLDILFKGDKIPETDEMLEKALMNTKSKVIIGANRITEKLEDEGARDEKTFTDLKNHNVYSKNEFQTNNNVGKFNMNKGSGFGIVEDIFTKPAERFLKNKERVDYAMVDMDQDSKSYITEAPIIIKVSEKVYDEKGNVIATQTIKPSFALRIALEKLDYDNKYILPNRLIELEKELEEKERRQEKTLKEIKIKNKRLSDSGVNDFTVRIEQLKKEIPEIKRQLANADPPYVEVQKKVFNDIRKDFCEGNFNGVLKIKDLEFPLNSLGRLYIKFVGSTRKGKHKKTAIESVSFFECLEDSSLKEYLAKNPESERLSPAFAHRRTLGGKEKNKGKRVYIVGSYDPADFDFYSTPVSYPTPFTVSNEPLMGIEIHASVINNILNRTFLKHPNGTVCILCIIICSIFCAFILEMVSPLVGAIISILLALAISIYSYFSYHILNQVFYIAPLLVSILSIWTLNTLVNYVKQRKKANTTKAMFSKFVSADVVQYMLDNPDLVKPGGSKTELTIFFSDVAGFTTISEGLSPEDLVILLNEYLGAMTDLLFEYGGTLDKFIGDAVMAFWNFPRKQEDHAVRAVLCAIAMQKKIKELQVDWARRGFPKVAARCGINTQDVVVGYMGSQKAQMNFTCMGDGVNLASRLEGANKEYGTMMMVSDNTYQRVKHAVRGRFLDFLAVKGKKEPVKVHELVCKIGDEPEGWFEKTELYDKAIQLHLERKWDEAIATFEEVLKLDPNDGPSKTYITRCNEYKINPPPEGWDGRYILTHK